MREEFIINQRGKDYVLYAGLLDAAHTKFLAFTMQTQLDASSPADQPRVIADFHGQYLDAQDVLRGIKTRGIGTAGRPGDRSGAAKEAPIEMAETRAKARALRDAVNVGATSLEEMPSNQPEDLEQYQSVPGRGAVRERIEAAERYAQGERPQKKAERENLAPIKEETLKSLRFHADTLAEARDESTEWHWQKFEETIGGAPADMTEEDGQKWIGRYKKGLAKIEQAQASDEGNYEERS